MLSFSNIRCVYVVEWLWLAILAPSAWAGDGNSGDLDLPRERARCFTACERFADLQVSPNGATVYAATDGGLLEFAREGTFRAKHTRRDGLCGHGVREIMMADDGSLWIATTAGVARKGMGGWRTFTMREGLNDLCVHSVAEGTGGQVYAGTDKGVCRYNGRGFEPFDDTHEFGRKPTYAIHTADNGPVWFVKQNAVTCFLGGRRWETFQNDPFRPESVSQMTGKRPACLITDRMGFPWIATEAGLERYDGRTWTRQYVAKGRKRPGFLDHRVMTLALDAAGRLWAGYGNTSGPQGMLGLSCFDGTWKHLSTRDGLPSDAVYRVRGDPTGGVWVATGRGGGYWNDKVQTLYHPVSELPDNHVLGFSREPGGRLAVRTVTGVVRFRGGERISEMTTVNQSKGALPNPPLDTTGVAFSVLGDNGWQTVLHGSEGKTWTATWREGLSCSISGSTYRVRLGGGEIPYDITCLCEESPGILWVGTATEGAIRLEVGTDPERGRR